MKLEPKAREDTTYYKFVKFWTDMITKPVVWFRETIVVPNRKEYPWYHEQLPRVPTVDECYTDDAVCIFEADQQFKRDRMIDGNIISILRRRFENCVLLNKPDHLEMCDSLHEQWQNAQTNFYIKYGELGYSATSKMALMKQKHRMVWERRHGPVGSGKRNEENE